MNVLNTIRSAFGLKSKVSDTPVDQLETVVLEAAVIQQNIIKAQTEYDDINQELSLKIAACDKMILKGNSEQGLYNKGVIANKLNLATSKFVNQVTELTRDHKSLSAQYVELEGQILVKAIEQTALLDETAQNTVRNVLRWWDQYGTIGDESITNQAQAIMKAIQIAQTEMQKGGEGSRGGKVIGHTKSGKAIYDSASHKGHRNFTIEDHNDAIDAHQKPRDDWHNGSDFSSEGKVKNDHHYEQQKDHIGAKNGLVNKEKENGGYSVKRQSGRGQSWTNHDHKDGHRIQVTKIDDEYHVDSHEGEGAKMENHGKFDKRGADAKVKELKEAKKKGGREVASTQYNGITKSHEPIAIEIAGKGDVEYDNKNIEGHYANAIVRKVFKEGEKEIPKILFLLRAKDKAKEPGKYCLPGGHIDEGETITQAATRELKEEANLQAHGGWVCGKAKCGDGKWAFYVEVSPKDGDVALLDGENNNAAWMCYEEWIEADLIYDLKQHLIAIDAPSTQDIKSIPDILKKGGGGEGS